MRRENPLFLPMWKYNDLDCKMSFSRWLKTRIPVAATILGKSVIGERHPLYLGVYEEVMGRKAVRK
jgi:TPP-dependent 2-oxoacid decarboxylase